jgi:hypothetical protein
MARLFAGGLMVKQMVACSGARFFRRGCNVKSRSDPLEGQHIRAAWTEPAWKIQLTMKTCPFELADDPLLAICHLQAAIGTDRPVKTAKLN